MARIIKGGGATLKASELTAFVKKAVKDEWGYVWSANGEIWTAEKAVKWAKCRNKPPAWPSTREHYFLTDCKRWINHMVAECSGLIVAAIRSVDSGYSDHSSQMFHDRATDKGGIKSIPEMPGIAVWKPGHIGVYIGDGYVIEERGTKYGAVKTRLKDRPWTMWLKLSDVDYSEYDGKTAKPELKKGSAGEAVKELQKVLSAKLNTDLKIDGIFGNRTQDAVKAFQKKAGIAADGIAGPVTWAKLS